MKLADKKAEILKNWVRCPGCSWSVGNRFQCGWCKQHIENTKSALSQALDEYAEAVREEMV